MENLPPHHAIFQQKGAELSQHESQFIIHHSSPVGTSVQQNTAAAFFARTHKRSPPILTSTDQTKEPEVHEKTNLSHISDFSAVLGRCPPPVPPSLLKKIESEEALGIGKVKVVLRVANSGIIDEKRGSFFKLDKKKRQVTLFDPSHGRGCSNEGPEGLGSSLPPAPKMFAFDGLYTDEDPQIDLCAGALVDPIHAVIQGTDAALFSFGHSSLGKTYTMIGSDESSRTIGIIPTAIAWLFRAIKAKKEKSSARFSVRVSALEIGGPKEEVRDLLSNVQSDDQSGGDPRTNGLPPSAYLSQTSFPYTLLPNQHELKCSTAEKAGDLLDAALTARSTNMASDIHVRDSHFVFTIHVYQYSVEPTGHSAKTPSPGVIGGRSRLHLIDFGNCDRTKNTGATMTLSGLGNVLLSIFNGQRHLPNKESRVTHLLKECLGSLSCKATMLAHVSPELSHYSETLHTTQLASRIHRMRRKKTAKGSAGSAGGSGGSGSSDENRHRFIRLPGHSSSSDFTTSTDPSSSEQSCDTVIYLGSNDDGTDAEHPPVYIPNLNSGDHRGQMAKALRGSTAEMPKIKNSHFEGKRSSDHSPSSSKSMFHPLFNPQFPQGSSRQRPGSVGSTPTHNFKLHPIRHSHLKSYFDSNNHAVMGGSLPRYPKGKMPLTGKVAGYRQAPSSPHSGFWGSPNKSETATFQQSPEVAESIYRYGYMDDHKKMMIQQWVECQKVQSQGGGFQSSSASSGSPVSFKQTSHHPEPFAWLKHSADSQHNNSEVICLTQFKTAESSDESVVDDIEQQSWKKFQERIPVSVDVHQRPQNCLYQLQKGNSVNDKVNGKIIQSPNFPIQKQETYKQLESKVQVPEEDEILSVTLQGGNFYLPDICEIDLNPPSGPGDVQHDTSNHKSSEENLTSTIKALDIKSFHYVKEDKNAFQMGEKMFPDVASLEVGEEIYSKKLDQLAKLHELYQSVSSINAKCQSHLENSKDQAQMWDVRRDKGSSFSLSAMASYDNHSIKSEASSSEVNSLCSEPVKMFNYSDFLGNVEGNNNTSALSDLFDLQCGVKFCMSLGDLEDLNQFLPRESEICAKQERSDSPVLEGIDTELAKYAKLKDLENKYEPSTQQIKQQPFGDQVKRCHPEGASDPDLNLNNQSSESPPARRSPGNGCSGSEPDETERDSRHLSKQSSLQVISSSTSPSCSSSLSSGNGNAVHRTQKFNGASSSMKNSSDNDFKHVSGQEVWKTPSQLSNNNVNGTAEPEQTSQTATKKGLKFSRLFKLSKSPLKVSTDKKRSKSVDPYNTRSVENYNEFKLSAARFDKKISRDTESKVTLIHGSKNVKGTSSSESSQTKPRMIGSHYAYLGGPKIILSSTSSHGSDSGHESGTEKSSKQHRSSSFIKPCTFVKLRYQGGRGAPKSTSTKPNNSKKKVESMADLRATHCRSSGYESGGGPGFDSEKDSVRSLKGAASIPETSPSEGLLNYDGNFITRLDYMRRFCEIKKLQKQREKSKDRKSQKLQLKSSKSEGLGS